MVISKPQPCKIDDECNQQEVILGVRDSIVKRFVRYACAFHFYFGSTQSDFPLVTKVMPVYDVVHSSRLWERSMIWNNADAECSFPQLTECLLHMNRRQLIAVIASTAELITVLVSSTIIIGVIFLGAKAALSSAISSWDPGIVQLNNLSSAAGASDVNTHDAVPPVSQPDFNHSAGKHYPLGASRSKPLPHKWNLR
jgi:hypothetical protein